VRQDGGGVPQQRAKKALRGSLYKRRGRKSKKKDGENLEKKKDSKEEKLCFGRLAKTI